MSAELRRRLFHVARLGRAYRYVVAFAAAQLVAATLLIALRNVLNASIWLDGRGETAIAPLAFAVCCLLLVVGLTYVLYAAIFVQRWVRLGLLGAYSALLAFPIFLRQSVVMSLSLFSLLAASWAVVHAFHARAGRSHDGTRRSRFHSGAFFSLFALVAAAQLLPLAGLGGVSYSARILALQFGALTIFVVPALLLAGADLAQMSMAAAELISSPLARRGISASLCTIGLAAVVLLAAPRMLIVHSPPWILMESLLFLALAALIVSLLWPSRAVLSRSRAHITAGAVAICALSIFGLTFAQVIGVAALQTVRPIYVSDAFSIEYPAGWSRSVVAFEKNPALGHAYAFTAPDGARLDVVQRAGSAPEDPLRKPPGAAIRRTVWTVGDGSAHWDLFAFAPASSSAKAAADFDSMRAAFRPGTGQRNPHIGQFEAYATLAGILALLLTAALRRKNIAVVGLFAVLAAVVWIFSHPAFFMLLLHMPESAAPVIDMFEVELFAAAGSVLVMAWLWLRRPDAVSRCSALLLGLNLSLAFACGLYALYGASMTASEQVGMAAAFIIFAALVWESVTSGELTNGHSAAFPQPGRICLFFGYVVLVVGVVLFFASVRFGANGNVIDPFQSELYPQKGLLLIGIPLIFTIFLTRFAHALREPLTEM